MLRGESANLLSVGAIDFGLVVDATVIMMENIFRHLRASLRTRSSARRRRARPQRATGCRARLPPSPIAATGSQPRHLLFRRHHRGGLYSAFHHERAWKAIFSARWRAPMPMPSWAALIATFTVTPALASVPAAGEDAARPRRICCAFCIVVYADVSNSRWPTGLLRWAVRGASVRAGAAGSDHAGDRNSCRIWKKAISGSAPPCPPSISLEAANSYVNQMRGSSDPIPKW